MKEILDKILLSENAVEEFYKNYKNPKFKNFILNVLPEIEKCENTKQDNPWHIYNCLDHILHSVENINKLDKNYDENTRLMLSYTMLLHDIGKPNCYKRRYSKLYNKEVDSFFNHNIASEKIAQRVLPLLNFDKSQQEIIKMLIREHDIFMFIKLKEDNNKYHKILNSKLIRDYVEKYGEFGNGVDLMKLLLMVGRADSMSQNPEMTKSSFDLLDAMGIMLEKYENSNSLCNQENEN